MRRRLIATVISLGLAAAAVMPTAVFAEEETETAFETEGELETEAEEEESFDYSAGYEESGFFSDVTALDYVTLPVYTGVRLATDEIVTEADLEAQVQSKIDSVVAMYATTEEVTEGVVEDGDTLNIDFVGSIDGVEFENGSTNGNGAEVTIGVTNFIDDFLYQLIGHEVGETVDVEVTFPDPYTNNPDLAGKDALFVTTINAIIETVEPEFNDEFVKENLEAESVEEYRQSQRDEIYETYTINALLTWLLEEAEISEIPESATTTVYNYQWEYIRSMYEPYGISVEDVMSYQGMTEESLREQCEDYAGQIIVMQAVMEDAGLEVTKELVMEVTGSEEESYETLLDVYGLGYVNNCLIPDCVARFMLESVEIYEPEIETEAETEVEAETEAATESELETEEESATSEE